MENTSTKDIVIVTAVAAVIGAAYILFNRKWKPKVLLKNAEEKYSVTLMEKIPLTHDVRKFRFKLPANDMELGLPLGQHIYLLVTIDNKLVIRPYTPTSDEHQKGYFDLVVKVYFKNVHPKFPDGGKMSQYLESMAVGDEMVIRGPNGLINYLRKGQFAVKKNKTSAPEMKYYKNVGMIAGGTGLTPMLQIISHALKDPRDYTKFFLLYANQTEKDIILREDLENLQACYPDRFKLWYTVDKAETTDWKYSTGFISDEMIKNHMPPADNDSCILLCGPPPMINFACNPNLDKLGYMLQNRFTF
ncbi:NADH-cytochrome b5 reductase 3-like isoform X1 [Leptotrombidium deliense]|uniref:NADH-cytochrome b5 reductase n=1 Tax=Leptotrombidium deliense TaxID=299467 RepID=A0A443SRN7_9ACAR|nr:NADH-cytochrome b5 reductase 3-like isoform X1 [Leptotrombidium deliense]